MNWSNQLETLAQMRVQQWEEEIQQRKLLAQVPPSPTHWQQWVGRVIVEIGMSILCFGERMTKRKSPQCLAAGESASY